MARSTLLAAVRRGHLAAVAAVFCLAALRAASAEAALSPPVALSAAGAEVSSPAVAENAAGQTVAAWVEKTGTNYRIQTASRAAGGTFEVATTVATITGPTDFPASLSYAPGVPQVAVAPNGSAVIAWQGWDGARDQIQAAYRPAGGTFGTPTTVSSANGTEHYAPELVALPNGSFLLAWTGSNGDGVQVSTRSANGFGTPASVGCFRSPQLAVDNAGNALLACLGTGTNGDDAVRAAYRPSGGSFGSLVTVGPATDLIRGGSPDVVVAFKPNGDAVALWAGPDHDNQPLSSYPLETSTRSKTLGTFSVPVAGTARYTFPAFGSIATDGTGATLAAVADGFVQLPSALAPVGQPRGGLGSFVAASSGFVGVGAVFVTRLSAGGTFGGQQTIPDPAGATGYGEQIASDGSGNVTVVYTRELGDGDTSIQAASGTVDASPADTTPPTISISSPTEGQHVALGDGVSSSFDCTDSSSGVASCTGPGTLDTATAGDHTFTVSATDKAGNTTTTDVHYVVDAPASPPAAAATASTSTAPPAIPAPTATGGVLGSTSSGTDTTGPSLTGIDPPKSVKVNRKGVVSIPLGRAPEDVTGSATLSVTAPNKRHATKMVRLGTATISGRKGARLTVRMRLGKAGRKLLHGRKLLRARLTVVLLDAAGNRAGRNYTLRLRG